MAVDTDFALAGQNGIASVAPTGTTAPVDTSALSTPWVDLGALSTDGLTEHGAETRTSFKRWGSIVPFKTIITDQEFTFDVTFLESNNAVLGLYYRVTDPTPDATTHLVTVTADTTGKQDRRAFVFDVVEGTNIARWYVPEGEVTDRKDVVYRPDGIAERGVTITAYVDANGVAKQLIGLFDANAA